MENIVTAQINYNKCTRASSHLLKTEIETYFSYVQVRVYIFV